MKKKCFAVIATCMAAMTVLLAAGCDDGMTDAMAAVIAQKKVAVESVTLDWLRLTLDPGTEWRLTATVLPKDAADRTVSWSSSDEAVATVGDDGTVMAHADGTATITARAGGKLATCEVTVARLGVTSVTLDQTALALVRKTSATLTATVTAANGNYVRASWSSDDETVATVDRNGTVTAVGVGTANITAQAGNKTATCKVTVQPIAVTGITLGKATLTLWLGLLETDRLTATVLPPDADDGTVSWSSDDETVATVGDDGTVTAVREGTATITAQAGTYTAECEVTVTNSSGLSPAAEAEFEISDGKITKYKGNAEIVIIPEIVTYIGGGAFKDCTSLRFVQIPSTVTSIGGGYFSSGAFEGCTNLTRVEIGSDVTSIGFYTFRGCTSLASVEIPASVTKIEGWAFDGCTTLDIVYYGGTLTQWCAMDNDSSLMWNAKSVILTGENNMDLKQAAMLEIPSSVTSIGSYAFEDCTSLTSVTIPASVTKIEGCAFDGCTTLDIVYYGGTLAQWCAMDNDSSLMWNAKSVILTGENNMDLKQAETLEIPDCVTSIGNYAFQGCTSLMSVNIPDSVTNIRWNAFEDCTSLTSVTIGSGVRSIGWPAFEGCTSLESV
ncbi:MAG: leucine-rich repeat protein, partial [Treponemataceae bacterium]|nr:leucine-rich repeat protein [Treponemataceae bacterium]